tara:strand:+ start:272 stop:661 length:390 start_codon:yes stop_codon:yes gene_type:complete
MDLKYIIVGAMFLFIFSCQKKEPEAEYSEDCIDCATAEEEISILTYTYNSDLILVPDDTISIIASLDSGIYCIGDLAFELDFNNFSSPYITLGNDTFYSNQSIFLETIDEDLLTVMTENGSCEFVLESE